MCLARLRCSRTHARARRQRLVLSHGWCPLVCALLLDAASTCHFSLVVAEGTPNGPGLRLAERMAAAGVPVRVIEPSAVARTMASVALVLSGAHAVRRDGGVVGEIGSFGLRTPRSQ